MEKYFGERVKKLEMVAEELKVKIGNVVNVLSLEKVL